MFSIDFLIIAGFIIFFVLKAMAEANQKKQNYRRKVAKPAQEVERTKKLRDIISGGFPPDPTFPWQELQEDSSEELLEYEAEGMSGSLEGVAAEDSLEGMQGEEGVDPTLTEKTNEFTKSYQDFQVSLTPDLAVPAAKFKLSLTEEQVWLGIVWSEILQPPRCRRRWYIR